jgi:hypothetical protein
MERDPRELLYLAPHMRGRMCYILIMGLKDPDLIVRRKHIDVSCDRLLIKMGKLGLLINIKPGVWKINLPYLQRVSYIVTDDLFDKISDPEYMFQFKKERGMYKTRKDYQHYIEGSRKKDRKARVAREQAKAKLEKKTISDDPFELENILFPSKEITKDE